MKRVAVVGAGTMGNGIAHVFAQHGATVTLIDVDAAQLERALKTIRANLDRQIKKQTLTEADRDATLGRITPQGSLDAAAGAELAVEAASENPTIKFDIFRRLDAITPPGCILATNTSSISVTEIAASTGRADRVIGMHFMNPVPVMQLVEVIRGLATSDGTMRTVMDEARALGKTPVEAADFPGFVSNRVLMPMINEAIFCVMEGVATPDAVDTVMKLGMNHPMGPLALADLIGLDVCLAILEVLHRGLGDDKYRPCPLLRKMVAAGRLGRSFGPAERAAAGSTTTASERSVGIKKRVPVVRQDSTDVFTQMAVHRHEQVSYWFDPETGYRGIVAIHSTALGPSLGGTRLWSYPGYSEALYDVLRLARGMTYKAAMAGLNLGGGKSVIIGDPSISQAARDDVFRTHGRHVESLGGRYITAEDVGTSPHDMAMIAEETRHVVGLAGRSGDPSPVTAWGTFRAMQACAHSRWGSDSLDGRTVAVQGVGHVGYSLCHLLKESGAALIVTDVDRKKVKRAVSELGAKAVSTEAIYGARADVFAPCALGAVLNDRTIPALKAEIVCGAANNQLAEERHGDLLDRKGILYAPDYVANAGGVINVSAELENWSLERAREKAGEIYDTVLSVLEIARDEGIPTYRAADRLAEDRVARAERARNLPSRVSSS